MKWEFWNPYELTSRMELDQGLICGSSFDDRADGPEHGDQPIPSTGLQDVFHQDAKHFPTKKPSSTS